MTISSLSAAALDRLHQAMAARVATGELPGIVTLIARGNDVHVDTIGMMAFSGDEPMRRDTIFRIASLTKPILAAATMMLVQDGTLALDEPVDRLLPELANRRVLRHVDGPLDDTVAADRPITVEDLLTFRMGHGMLIEPTFDPPFPIIRAANELQLVLGPPDPRTPHDPDRWIGRFATLPLMYQPGERWQYNTGSLVLGVLIGRAAGQPLGRSSGGASSGPWAWPTPASPCPPSRFTGCRASTRPTSRPAGWSCSLSPAPTCGPGRRRSRQERAASSRRPTTIWRSHGCC